LVKELNESPLLISMWRAFYQQIFKSLPTLGKFLILLLSERANLFSVFIYLRHQEELVVKFTQQAFPRCNRSRGVGIQPSPGSIMKGEREESKVDKFIREIMEFKCGANVLEFLYVSIGVFMIQAMKRRQELDDMWFQVEMSGIGGWQHYTRVGTSRNRCE
jgi:hypothetical protein